MRFFRLAYALTTLLIALSGSAHADIITGLQNYYSFSDANAPGLEGSGNNRHGAVTGAVWANDPVRGGVLEFNDNDVVSASAPALSPSGFTVSLWALRSPTAPSGNRGLFILNNNVVDAATQKTIGSWVSTSDQVWGRIRVGGSQADLAPNANATTPDGVWTHLTLRGTGSEYQVFQNGVNTGNSAAYAGATFNETISALFIGRQGTESWAGRLDDVRVYNRSLSESDIAQLYTDTQSPYGLEAKFDVNSGASPTQAGFTPIVPAATIGTNANAVSSSSVTSSSGITLTMSASLNEHRDRNGMANGFPLSPTDPQYDLLRDFAFENDSQNVQLDLTGLEPSTQYQLRIYSFDWDSNDGAVSNWYQDSIGGTPLYTHTNDWDDPSTGYFDLLLRANAQGGIRLLAQAGTGGIVIFNGLEVTQVPEPSSLVLAGLGLTIAVAVHRRRRRGRASNQLT